MDQQRPECRAEPLRGSGVSARAQRASPQFRPRSGGRDVGAPAVARRTTVAAALAAGATGVLVGSAIVATRAIVDQAGPATIALLRYLIGALCLLPLALWSRPR